MKKFFLTIFSLALSLVLCFSLAGCGKSSLAFSNNFAGDNGKEPTSMTEVLTYKIDYVKNYNEGYVVKSDKLADNVIKCDYSGTHTQTFEIVGILPSYVDEKSNIDTSNHRIYHLKNETTINATYYANGAEQPQTFTDTIYQEIYFLPANMSFAPIYSKVEQKNTLVYLDDSNKITFSTSEYSAETIYNNKNYEMNKTIGTEKSHTQRKYDFRQLVDNNQFLFATRNVKISQGSSITLPVLSFSYGYPVNLSVKNLNERTLSSLPINYNGQALVEDVQIQELVYIVGSSKNAGAAQFVLIQKQGSETLPYSALPVQIVETLTTYGSFESLGALVYTLTDVSVTR